MLQRSHFYPSINSNISIHFALNIINYSTKGKKRMQREPFNCNSKFNIILKKYLKNEKRNYELALRITKNSISAWTNTRKFVLHLIEWGRDTAPLQWKVGQHYQHGCQAFLDDDVNRFNGKNQNQKIHWFVIFFVLSCVLNENNI